MAFRLYTSNRLEILADKLAEVVAQPLSSPLTAETIIVQSFGMQQWIALELARRFGVWANCSYPFPNTFLQDIFKQLVPDAPDTAAFDRDVMTWRVMQLLPQCINQSGFELLKTYLEQDSGCFRAWQLSRQIANVFDQYGIYRPNMILKWEEGRGTGWQRDLWLLLTRGQQGLHRAAVRREFFAALRDSLRTVSAVIPQRVAIFGISTLPPFHLAALAALAQHCDVNLFLMNPSQEYWAEIKTDYEINRTRRRAGCPCPPADDLHLETGNSLLASMGRLGRDFLGMVMDYDPELYSCFKAPAGSTLLHKIQADLLSLVDRGAPHEESAQRLLLAEQEVRSDNSISIHSCHSPLREVEVLHDFLLDVFNHHPAVKPRDILVMTPDIELYAPFIRAVFDSPGEESGHVPYAIADRALRRQSVLVKTCFAVLELGKSRFGVSRVLDILECPAVRQRFNLLPEDIDLIHEWCRETRICWGMDAAHRARLGLPEMHNNTWRAGIERLLLGYAMPGREERMFAGILPYDNIEGGAAQVLGNFLAFLETLFSVAIPGDTLWSLKQWREKLLQLVDALFAGGDDYGDDLQTLRTVIGELDRHAALSGFTESVGLDVIAAWLDAALREQHSARSFLTGQVTFCAMLPMRSIPFKVICMMGMNDTAFPRRTAAVSFDLIAQHPRRGDRSLRDDDRYLFLEAVISAREKLYISYVGQGIQDNSMLPPSVLVSELLDYIEQGYAVSDRSGAAPRNRIQDFLVVKHRLQAFSPRYFEPQGNLYSYSPENCNASRALCAERREAAPFMVHELPGPAPEKNIISISDLIVFFSNPAKYLLNRVLGLYLDGKAAALEEREPFQLTGLDKYQLEQRLCERYIQEREAAPVWHAAAAAGLLPHGAPGEGAVRAVLPQLMQFSEAVKSCIRGEPCAPVAVTCEGDGYCLAGTIHDVRPGGLVRYRCAAVKARDRLRLWIEHLALNAHAGSGAPVRSILIGTDGVWETEPPGDSTRMLFEQLVKLYQSGLRSTLQFYPESSFAYVAALQKGKPREAALKAALSIWESYGSSFSEGSDPYYRLCFSGTDPLGTEFEALSRQIFEPLMHYQKQVSR